MKVIVSRLAAAVALSLAVGVPAQAGLVFVGNGELFVTQSQLDRQWVQVKVDVKTAVEIDTIAGGFGTVGSAVFSQDPADRPHQLGSAYDTAFVGNRRGTVVDIGALFGLPPLDTPTELSTVGAGFTSADGRWGPAGERYTLAQLVLPAGGQFRMLALGDVGADGLGLISNGVLVGDIRGDFTTVPEPGTLTLAACGCLCLGAILMRRPWIVRAAACVQP